MGQLERYGLYVLVLVIFLILGVAIWGTDPAAAAGDGGGLKLDGGERTGVLQRLDKEREQDAQRESLSAALNGSFELEDVEPLEDDESAPLSNVLEDLSEDDGASPIADSDSPLGGGASGGDSKREGSNRNRDEVPGLREYTIKSGDTLTEIAQRMLGTSRAWKLIVDQNPGLDPLALQAGRKIQLPHRKEVLDKHKGKRRGQIAKEYVVRKGDNPSKIAERVLGSQKHAQAIMDANNISDPRRLVPGKVLVIPNISKK